MGRQQTLAVGGWRLAVLAGVAGSIVPITAIAQPVMTAADRISIKYVVEDSVMLLQDVNGDCDVTDVDIALAVEARLTELYGPTLAVGDLDGNGGQNGEDVVLAITRIVLASFGRVVQLDGAPTMDDAEQTAINVANSSIEGDINLDGNPDAFDIIDTIAQIGVEISPVDLDRAVRELFTYIGVIRERGRASFMATECAPKNHLLGISSTWPADHPKWWPDNHMTGVSRSYDENRPGHDTNVSTLTPTPAPHEENLSSSWPANHLASSSDTWDKPKVPSIIPWSDPLYPPPHHLEATSTTWPAGHTKVASATWPSTHDNRISRTWWPHHTESESSSHIIPPMHITAASQMWRHATALSQAQWPSNHYPSVSDGWGPGHRLNLSSAFPPAHVSDASNGWPGPQESWPPGHTVTVSRSWGEPVPGSWPLLPPDHTWFTTFRDIVSPIAPRKPWPGASQP